MNIGLQPQYPTLWWIDAILGGILILALLEELIVTPRIVRARKARLEAEYKVEKAEYDSRKKSHELELVQKGSSEVAGWYERPPQFTYQPSDVEPPPVGWGFGIVAAILLFGVGLATIVSCVPFNTKYYNYYVMTGTVSQVVTSVDLGQDSSTNDFTVALAGDQRRYNVTDPIIKTLQGDKVSLLCGVGWNNQAADTWTCSIRSYAGSTP